MTEAGNGGPGMDIWSVFAYTAAVTVVGLLLWLVKLIFHDKLDARWHYFIWLVLLARLLVPTEGALLRTPVSVFEALPVFLWIKMARLHMGDSASVWGERLLLLYGAGAVLLGGYYLVVWAVLRIRVRRADRAPEETVKFVEEVAKRYGVKPVKEIRVRDCATPYICGLFHPILVLPGDWRALDSPEAALDSPETALNETGYRGNVYDTAPGPFLQDTVILHELVHYQYRDVAVNLLLHLVRVLHWFNPVVWWLTAVVQNDGEALCDQRVLERCARSFGAGQEDAAERVSREYGNTLLRLTSGKRGNPAKIGTSNMASSYRNMKTRIHRIADFKKIPSGIGMVTLCITLILALAGSGSAEGAHSFEIPEMDSEKSLESALVYARCYEARTPEEAVYLFLRAVKEKNLLYRMAVLPAEQAADYEQFAKENCIRGTDFISAQLPDYGREEGAYSPYFPRENESFSGFEVYNLQYDEEDGSGEAEVCAYLGRGSSDETEYVTWRLGLKKEEGWKAVLEAESERKTGEYHAPALLIGTARLGDFLVEIEGFQFGYFAGLEAPAAGTLVWRNTADEGEKDFPDSFTMEYKIEQLWVSYQGEEALEGKRLLLLGVGEPEEMRREEHELGAFHAESLQELHKRAAELAGLENMDDPEMESGGGSVGDGSGWRVLGREELKRLQAGEPVLIFGGGNGSPERGMGWKPDDVLYAYVQIWIDDKLEEGEVWSENH